MRFAPHTALPRVKGVHQPRDSAVFFSKQTATATAGGRRASVEQVGTGGEGRRRGRAVIHILPPPLRCPPVRHRWQAIPRTPPPPTPPPPPPPPHDTSQTASRAQAVKGRQGEGSSTQTIRSHSAPPDFRPPVYVVRCGSQCPGSSIVTSSLSLCDSCRRIFPFSCE